MARSPSGVIFTKRVKARQRTYGCLYKVGKVHALAGQNQSAHGPLIYVTEAKLSGRFAAYVLTVDDYYDYDEIAVYDLRRGQLLIKQFAQAGYVDAIRDFVAKRNGSVAWIVQGVAYDENSGKSIRVVRTRFARSRRVPRRRA